MTPELPAWDAPRDCEYCGESFQPKREQDRNQKFHTANCRKNFFRYGVKLRVVAAIQKHFDRKVEALEKRIVALERKSAKGIDTGPELVVTLQPGATQ